MNFHTGNKLVNFNLTKKEGRKYYVSLDEELHNVEIERINNNLYLLKIGDKIYNCFIHKNGLNYFVNINGRYFEIEKSSEYKRNSTKKGFSSERKEIRARMPGRVKKVLKEKGELVKEGEGVLVVEAMKMENEIKSPAEGKIKEIHTSPGKNLETGDLLFIVE